MNDEIILIDKPAGWTSFDVVAKIRGSIKHSYLRKGEKPTKRQLKVGHAGTLDPFATGLLILLLGEATKKADTFLKLDKAYETTIRLGYTSSTGDPEGQITKVSSLEPTMEQVQPVLERFTGDITQTPPAHSAIKINGQRAYKLARRGEIVDIPTRQVTIYDIELIDYTYPNLTIRASVSSGTYIRSLATDIGTALETGGYCQSLRRISIADYSVDQAKSIDEIVASIDD